MRALVITPAVKRHVSRVREFAESNPISLYQIKKIIEGVSPPPGDDDRFVCAIPRGFRCVYTVETHMNDTTVRHLSVSVDAPDKYPMPVAINEIMKLFGFTGVVGDAGIKVYTEEGVEAVNVIERLN